ncbi:Histone H4 [Taphrina deformans PYCC 5710]|uniref:Histone H4 n=1 Tax=Taphrina deformans (strain PYCC 5710 / ATCC 11124 / CBS 356.35 / IMI 108563 / JCM 9778 / NBRC 8474) TaxID=1097556 RepID=R4X7T6_TAPDE|nr:Histone H4 [Taphrina deformans PYCC 5710]|eukprot:CCG81511.1 Histone H4 [Taphrina deformans PYCC 5710]
MPPSTARSITAKQPRFPATTTSTRSGPGFPTTPTGTQASRGAAASRPGQARRRHRKVLKDTIQGITRADIRRMARRGGVTRISAGIYNETRYAMKDFMVQIIGDAVACVELRRAQTMAFQDVIYALKRRGHTLYGFGPDIAINKKRAARRA